MKKFLLPILLIAIASPAAFADSHESNTSVLNLFTCNLNPGMDRADVFDTLEALRDGAAPPAQPDPGFGTFVWFPLRGATGYDYVWGVLASDLAAWGSGLQNYMATPHAAAMGPRFNALGDCSSVIVNTEQVKAGKIGLGQDRELDAIVETFSCSFAPGKDMDDMMSATTYWQGQMEKIDSTVMDSYEAFVLNVFRGGTGEYEFGWIGTYPDLATFGQGSMDYYGSKAGQAADARFADVGKCRSALWTGYWITTPQNLLQQ
jgi:hypothetical protein